MRLRRLGLTRYGKFTDFAVDFGPSPDGAPDFHVIYGPNEAGKSTVFNAWTDFLFGIEAQSRYDFVHDYAAMRIDAEIEAAGALHRLARIKKAKGSLLDGDDRPADETPLLATLAGVDRAGYRAMFSLDDDTLEKGGEGILESRGELGRMLYSASAGLGDLSQRLSEIRAELDAFHRPRGRTTRLADAKKRLEELRAAREAADLSASTYRTLQERAASAEVAYETARKAEEAARGRDMEIGRLRRAHPALARIARADHTLAELADLPEVPEDWTDRRRRLEETATELAARIDASDTALAQLDADLEALTPDRDLLDLGPRIDALSETAEGASLEARFATALADLPARRRERETAAAETAARAADLGAGGPDADVALASDRIARLKELAAEHSRLQLALETARREESAAARALEAAAGSPPAEGPALAEPETAAALLERIRHRDPLAAVAAADAQAAALEARRDGEACALRPWQGPVTALAQMAVPGPRQLEEWQSRDGAHRAARAEAENNLRRARDERDEAEATLRDARQAVHGLDPDAAAEIRARRDAALAEHRTRLDAASLAAFAALLAEDDALRDRQLAAARELAALSAAEATVVRAGRNHAAAERALAEMTEAADALAAEIAAAVAASACGATVALPPDLSLAAFLDWLRARDRVLATETEHQTALRARSAARAEAATLADGLAGALGAADLPRDLARLVARAEALLKAHERAAAEHAHWQAGLADRRETCRARAEARQAQTVALERWAEVWRATVAGTWLEDAAGDPARLADGAGLLAEAARTRMDLDRRIRAMEQDRDRYAGEIAEIARVLGWEIGADGPEAIGRTGHALRSALRQARENAARRATLEKRREAEIEAGSRLETDQAALEKAVAEMTAALGVATLAEAGTALDRITERRRVRADRDERIGDLLADLDAPDLAAAEARLAGTEPEALEAEAVALAAALPDLVDATRDAAAHRRAARDALDAVGGDDRAARIAAERQTELVALEAEAEAHLSRRLGLAAVERALALYRERHRSEMLEAASRAFALITNGAYAGLLAQAGKGGELLFARRADGATRAADALSKGTRFQLYLALRLAGYRALAAAREPLPFIADDIMETFDEMRAEEALRLFAEMAGIGQVIYLTHHRHLCEIARESCPGVRIHALP
ncbi:MAG: AAA family ATPase [Paracoccaceae bacterium]